MNSQPNYIISEGPPRRQGLNFIAAYLTTITAVVLFFVFLDIANYVHILNGNIQPKYFYYVLFLMISPFLLLKPKALTKYLVSPFSLWAFSMVIFNSIDFINFANTPQEVLSLIATRNQFLILSVAFGFFLSIARVNARERLFRIIAVIIALSVIIDFLHQGFFYAISTAYSVPGRGSAFFITPTRAGEAMVITSLFAIPTMRMKYCLPFLLLMGTGIFLTFSRGSIIVWLLFFVFLLLTRSLPRNKLMFIVLLLLFLPSLLGHFETYLSGRQDLSGGVNDILSRLNFLETHDLSDNSALERVKLLENGWALFLQNPIFGAGTGATKFWALSIGTHNQLIMLAAEHGIVGIMLWIFLAVILWKGKYFKEKKFQIAALAIYALFSFFTHNMFDDLYWLVTFALISGQQHL